MRTESVLGINRRNVELVMPLNKRSDFVLVDDKVITKSILERNAIPAARMLCSTDSFFGVQDFMTRLASAGSFALKPANGSGGNGIVVVREVRDGNWRLADGAWWDTEAQRDHIQNILYGTFSLGAAGDTAFAEELINTHPDLLYFSDLGLPDVRIILHLGKAVLSMLRVPTRRSHGKANLHAGGFAVAVDTARGITAGGWYRSHRIENHPETGVPLHGRAIPYWEEIRRIADRLYDLFPLGYMGVDFALDDRRGPLILELNARPGLEIQNVTGTGLGQLVGGGAP